MLYLSRDPLLTPKGRLTEPGWSPEDVFVYNKESMRSAARRREWEYYQVSNARYAFQIMYGHGPKMGLANVTLIDFETGEKYRSGKRKLFPGDSFDLDFSGGEPHSLKYEDDDLFLSVGFDGAVRRIAVRSNRFDAELCCYDTGDAIVTAAPFARKTQFLYSYKKCFPDLTGHIHMHKLDYRLNENSFLLLSSGRGVLPRQSTRIWAAGGQRVGEHVYTLNLGDLFGPNGSPTENAVFVDGELQKLGRAFFKFKGDGMSQPWTISDSSRRVHLEFFPDYDHYERVNLGVADIRRHRLYGKLYGTVALDDGDEWEIDEMHFFVEHTGERW